MNCDGGTLRPDLQLSNPPRRLANPLSGQPATHGGDVEEDFGSVKDTNTPKQRGNGVQVDDGGVPVDVIEESDSEPEHVSVGDQPTGVDDGEELELAVVAPNPGAGGPLQVDRDSDESETPVAPTQLVLFPIFGSASLKAAIRASCVDQDDPDSEFEPPSTILEIGARVDHCGRVNGEEVVKRLAEAFFGDGSLNGDRSKAFVGELCTAFLDLDLVAVSKGNVSKACLQRYLCHLLSAVGVVDIAKICYRPEIDQALREHLRIKKYFVKASDAVGHLWAEGRTPFDPPPEQCNFLTTPEMVEDELKAVPLIRKVDLVNNQLESSPASVLRRWQKNSSAAMTEIGDHRLSDSIAWLRSEGYPKSCFQQYIGPLVVSRLAESWSIRSAVMMVLILLMQDQSSPVTGVGGFGLTDSQVDSVSLALQAALILYLPKCGDISGNSKKAGLASVFVKSLKDATIFWIIPVSLPEHATYLLVQYQRDKTMFRLVWFDAGDNSDQRTWVEPEVCPTYSGVNFEYKLVPLQMSLWLSVPESDVEVEGCKTGLFSKVFDYLSSIEKGKNVSLHDQFPTLFMLSTDVHDVIPVQSVGNCTLWNLHQAIRYGLGWVKPESNALWYHLQMAMAYEAVRLRFSDAPSKVSFTLPA